MRLDHLLSMENVRDSNGVTDRSEFKSRQKPKQKKIDFTDGENSGLARGEYESVVVQF